MLNVIVTLSHVVLKRTLFMNRPMRMRSSF